MNESGNENMTVELRARIDAHLDAVETQLATAGVPREKRRGIVDDLETQIIDMLDAEKGHALSATDIDDLFRRLDPPQAYGKDSPDPAPRPPAVPSIAVGRTLCPYARKGAWWITLAIAAQVVLTCGFLMVNIQTPSTSPNIPTYYGPSLLGQIILVILVTASLTAPVAGTWLGWIAVESIRQSHGRLYGLGLAVIEAILYPLVALWVAAFFIWYLIVVAYYNGSEISDRGRAICVIAEVLTSILFSVGLIWLLARSTRPGRSESRTSAPVGPMMV